jgi:hypothetical protein
MINLAEIATDADFAQSYTVIRSSGSFVLGGWSNTTSSVPMYGAITVASSSDLEQVTEGDRVTGAMTFYSTQQLYVTRAGTTPGLSDIIAWRGQNYRLVKIFDYLDYGWNKAVGLRMSGE